MTLSTARYDFECSFKLLRPVVMAIPPFAYACYKGASMVISKHVATA
jgi:hypothetical protein